MKELKEIEIAVHNEVMSSEKLGKLHLEKKSRSNLSHYLKGLKFCHKLLIDRISFLEKQ